jgi:hypothetical protein
LFTIKSDFWYIFKRSLKVLKKCLYTSFGFKNGLKAIFEDYLLIEEDRLLERGTDVE